MDKNIKNIVFDLGGVLINLDFERAFKAFKKAGFVDIESQLQSFSREGIFDQFELGEISEDEFRSAIKERANVMLTDQEIDDMWNLILMDIPREKLELILNLRGKYMVYIAEQYQQDALGLHLPKCLQLSRLSCRRLFRRDFSLF